MKKKNIIITVSIFAVAVVTALTAWGVTYAIHKDETEILNVMMESIKCNDPERYLGSDVENLSSASAEEKAAFVQKFNKVLDQTFTDNSYQKQQCNEILDSKINSEEFNVLRSIDLGYSERKINSIDINGDTATATMCVVIYEKVITKQEGSDQYISEFPFYFNQVKATLKRVDNKWKIESSELLYYTLGSKDEGHRKSFETFKKAYKYSKSVTPDTSSAESLNWNYSSYNK